MTDDDLPPIRKPLGEMTAVEFLADLAERHSIIAEGNALQAELLDWARLAVEQGPDSNIRVPSDLDERRLVHDARAAMFGADSVRRRLEQLDLLEDRLNGLEEKIFELWGAVDALTPAPPAPEGTTE